MTGTNSYDDEEQGNTVDGDYVRTKNGTDNFTITIVGTKTGGAYDQLVTGTETYTLVDNGNTGHYEREIDVDSSSYTCSSTGPGAEMPSDSGSTDYHWEQTGDPHSGTFDLTKTGTSRYDLLEDFFDISNTGGGQTPGHMMARKLMEETIENYPRAIQPRVLLGRLLMRDGPAGAAAAVYQDILRLDPAHGEANRNLKALQRKKA
jgi:hypothetical protein